MHGFENAIRQRMDRDVLNDLFNCISKVSKAMRETLIRFKKSAATSALILAVFVFSSIGACGQEDESETSKAAENATNPLAFVTKLQFQPVFNKVFNKGYFM
ncbi:hypothetical protein [Robiginitalea sp.]|uniref:hypothetical protein n=1 Tax=Robiginitalea sp. TaxID=1902411 RepID=UPI003C78C3CB